MFHEDCIERWILKAKHRNILCPVCRVNIKEELDANEQCRKIEQLEDSKEKSEDSKEDLEHSKEIHTDENQLIM